MRILLELTASGFIERMTVRGVIGGVTRVSRAGEAGQTGPRTGPTLSTAGRALFFGQLRCARRWRMRGPRPARALGVGNPEGRGRSEASSLMPLTERSDGARG